MSLLYGTVTGQSDISATRSGSRNSGIRVSAQSFDGSVIVDMDYLREDDFPTVRIGTSDISATSTDYGSPDFVGTFEDFKKLLQLAQDIKTGKVSVVRHREKSNKQLALERAFR